MNACSETHMMADGVEWKGATQRFCQQCGRFHPLDAFSGSMRSCRKQLAKHAERRRRSRELAAQAAAAAASGSDATHLQTASAAAGEHAGCSAAWLSGAAPAGARSAAPGLRRCSPPC